MAAPALDRSAPSTAAIAIATAIVAGLGGFFLGQVSTLGIGGASKRKAGTTGDKELEESSDEEDAEGEDEEDDKQELGDFSTGNEECKLVLVVRTDLGMTKGILTF